MDLYGSMSVFVQIAEKGSLTAAASAVGISPTMVGNHLHSLETRLGMSLLHRTTRRQSLTDFGRAYYDRCVEILRLVTEADAHALANHAVPRGRLRVTAPVSFGTEGLMPVLGDYNDRYPDVELNIELCDRTVDLIEEGFEAAIRIGNLPDSGLVARQLRPYRMMICASPDYLAKHGEPKRPEDLAHHHCMSFRYSAGSAWRMTNDEGTKSVRVSSTIQVNNGQAIRVAALSGLGIVMQPEILLSKDVVAGRLIRLLPDYKLPSRPMHIVFLRDRHMSPKLRSFIDFVAERFGPESYSVSPSLP
jgi:DNA-binding transcriptional LysR family regulator